MKCKDGGTCGLGGYCEECPYVDGNKDTYKKPKQGWTCFHCGETFTNRGCAQHHFGATPDAQPGCLIKVSLGGERGLLMALRKAEAIIARYVRDDIDTQQAMFSMQSRHSDALEDAEILGYERGLRDGMARPTDSEVE